MPVFAGRSVTGNPDFSGNSGASLACEKELTEVHSQHRALSEPESGSGQNWARERGKSIPREPED